MMQSVALFSSQVVPRGGQQEPTPSGCDRYLQAAVSPSPAGYHHLHQHVSRREARLGLTHAQGTYLSVRSDLNQTLHIDERFHCSEVALNAEKVKPWEEGRRNPPVVTHSGRGTATTLHEERRLVQEPESMPAIRR